MKHKKFSKTQALKLVQLVRVPVKWVILSIYLETEKPMDLIKLKSIINSSKGVILIDNPKTQSYPVPRDVIDSPFVYVGRVRMDLKRNNACALWVVLTIC